MSEHMTARDLALTVGPPMLALLMDGEERHAAADEVITRLTQEQKHALTNYAIRELYVRWVRLYQHDDSRRGHTRSDTQRVRAPSGSSPTPEGDGRGHCRDDTRSSAARPFSFRALTDNPLDTVVTAFPTKGGEPVRLGDLTKRMVDARVGLFRTQSRTYAEKAEKWERIGERMGERNKLGAIWVTLPATLRDFVEREVGFEESYEPQTEAA